MGRGDFVTLVWMEDPEVIGVHYGDIFKNKFIAIVTDDISEIRSFDDSFKDIIINSKSFSKADIELMLALAETRITSKRNELAYSFSSPTNSSTLVTTSTNPKG